MDTPKHKGGREVDGDSNINRPGHTLFVTGWTPTPAPETMATPTPRSRATSRFQARSELPGNFADHSRANDQEETEIKDEGYEDGDEDDGDDQSIDDDEYGDDTYHQEKEPFPTHIAYDKRLPGLLQRASTLVAGLQSKLEPYSDKSEDVRTMHGRAKAAEASATASKPLIMLLGHTGTGKSSTTNSFLDEMNASKTGSTGDSSDIHFLDEQARTRILREHAKNYILYNFDIDPDWSEEMKHHHETRATTALKVFQALFCDQHGFDSPGAIKRFFAEHRTGLDEAITALCQWCTQLLSQYDQRDGHHILRFEAETAEEIHDGITPHIFDRGNFDEPVLWPLVDHVCKGLRGSRILHYVDFLDLPGTTDTNTIRAEIAHKFVTEATALWVVSPVTRVIADAELDLALATYGPRFGNNVAITATRSDSDVDDGLARDMREAGQSVGQYWDLAQAISDLRNDLAAVETSLGKCHQRKRAKTSNNSQKEQKLRDKKYDLIEQIEALGTEQYDDLVAVRAAYLTRRLTKEKQKHLAPGARLAAFAVSNTHYAAYKGGECKDKHRMRMETTNIPALRDQALRLAAPQQFHASAVNINEALLALQGAVLWKESPPTKRSDNIMSIVDQPAQMLRPTFEACLESSQESVASQLINPLEQERNLFSSRSLEFAGQLQKNWNHSSVRAFFAKNGKHKTASQPYEVWNERFTDDQKHALEPRFQNLVIDIVTSTRTGIGEFKSSIRNIPEQLSSSADAVPIAIEPLKDILEGFITKIQLKHDKRETELNRRLENIKLDATKDVPSAYFTRATNAMYEEAKTIKGNGCMARLHALLGRCLRSETPFASVTTGLQKDLIDVLAWYFGTLQQDNEEILRAMKEAFQAILTRSKESLPEQRARAWLKPFHKRAKPEAEAIRRELIELKLEYGVELSEEEKLMHAVTPGRYAR